MAIANLDNAWRNGDSTDRAFAIVNLGLASFAFISSHWAAFSLTAQATAATIPQITTNAIVGEAAEDSFVLNAQANGLRVAARKANVNTPFGRRELDVVLEDPNTGLNYGVEVKSSLAAFRRFDAAARQQFSADRWINQYGAVGIGQHEGLNLAVA